MLIGVDTRDSEFEGRSDSMIFIHVNPETKKIITTSFLRDMYVNIPEYGGNRLNAAYVFGGPELLFDTISDNFGIEIEDYVRLNFWLVIDILDDLGDKAHAAGAACGHLIAGNSVLHDHAVNIIKDTQLDKLLLTAQIGDLALLDHFVSPLQLNAFFGRNSHEGYVTGQMLHNARFLQTVSNTHQGCDLCMMAAGMCSTGNRVSTAMFGADNGVQLAHNGDLGIVCLTGDIGDDTGHSDFIHIQISSTFRLA